MNKDFEELIERAAAELPAETADEAIDTLAAGFQMPRDEMAKLVEGELGHVGPSRRSPGSPGPRREEPGRDF